MNLNQAASKLADREELQGDVQNARLVGKKEQVQEAKTQVGYCMVTVLQGMAGVYEADYLASTDEVIPDRPV